MHTYISVNRINAVGNREGGYPVRDEKHLREKKEKVRINPGKKIDRYRYRYIYIDIDVYISIFRSRYMHTYISVNRINAVGNREGGCAVRDEKHLREKRHTQLAFARYCHDQSCMDNIVWCMAY